VPLEIITWGVEVTVEFTTTGIVLVVVVVVIIVVVAIEVAEPNVEEVDSPVLFEFAELELP
jgi:hypothetical protein